MKFKFIIHHIMAFSYYIRLGASTTFAKMIDTVQQQKGPIIRIPR